MRQGQIWSGAMVSRPFASFAANGKKKLRRCSLPKSHAPIRRHALFFSPIRLRRTRARLWVSTFHWRKRKKKGAREVKKGGRGRGRKNFNAPLFFPVAPIESILSERTINMLTCPLPGQAAPEGDVGQHSGESRHEGHEGGCVERHSELRERKGGVF